MADHTQAGEPDLNGAADRGEAAVDWETPWDPPRPEVLPDLRASLAEQTCKPTELMQMTISLQLGKGLRLPGTSPQESACIPLDQEYRRLTNARLYFATPEMTRLVPSRGASDPRYDGPKVP